MISTPFVKTEGRVGEKQNTKQADLHNLWMTKTILDKSRTPIYRLSPQGQVQYVNQAACDSLGYSNDELVGLYPWNFDPDFKAEYWPGVWENLKQDEIVHITTRHQRKDGTYINVEVTGHFIAHGDDEFSFVFVQDVTDKTATQEAIRRKESYLRALIDNCPFIVWLKDKDSHFLTVNQAYAESYGYESPEQIVGKSDFDLSPPDLAEHYRAHDRSIMESHLREVIEEQFEGPQDRHWVETFKAPVLDDNGEVLGTVGFSRDITERKAAEAELRMTAAIFNSQVGMVVTDSKGQILKVNEAFTQVTGYSPNEVIGQRMNLLNSDVHEPDFYAAMWKSIIDHGSWEGEIWNRRKNGENYPQWLTVTAIKGGDGDVINYVGTMLDITHRKALEEKMHRLAHYDTLTELPNRALLLERLQSGIAHAKRTKALLCLLYMDLDRFKEVNDSLGHDIGDLLLKEAAKRIKGCLKRETDTVARIGGDEFIGLLTSISSPNEAVDIAAKILDALKNEYNLNGTVVNISASIGIAFYPLHAEDADGLTKAADTALYEAKNAGRNLYKIAPLE